MKRTDPWALRAALLLMAIAFAGSFTHVVGAVVAWGQAGWLAYLIAAMPELTVALAMRRIVTGTADRTTWVALASSGAFTLAGNLHGAQHSLGGYLAAAAPAYFAVLALALGVHQGEDAAQLEQAAAEVVTEPELVAEPAAVERAEEPAPAALEPAPPTAPAGLELVPAPKPKAAPAKNAAAIAERRAWVAQQLAAGRRRGEIVADGIDLFGCSKATIERAWPEAV